MTRPLLEAEFQGIVIELAHTLGWRHLHVRRSIGKGRQWTTATNVPWPDLTLWRPSGLRAAAAPEFIVRELKVPPVKWQPGQLDVLNELLAAGVDAGFWIPGDLDDGTILATLRRERTVRPGPRGPRTAGIAENRPLVTDPGDAA